MKAMLRPMTLIFSLSLLASPLHAQKRGGGGEELSADYAIEIAPMIAMNLPYDLWGTPGTLNTLGARGSIRMANENGALEGAALYHHAGEDNAYTIEAAYRFETYTGFLNGFFSIGLHYSVFNLEPDRNASGECVLDGCLTDSGQHYGLTYGGGIMLPTGQYPVKLGIRFYQNPQQWLLLEAAYGIRF
jgi:hypothetical protein